MWHSNAPQLERDSQEQPAESEDIYAKLQLGSASVEGSKLLGLSWNKAEDTLSVWFPEENAEITKRGISRETSSNLRPSRSRFSHSIGRKASLPRGLRA